MTDKTVWVIEQGSYSYYHVVGVYTTQQAAERVCEAINAGEPYEKAEVSKWPLNPAADEICQGLRLFRVLMLRDGSVEEVERVDGISSYEISDAGRPRVYDRSKFPGFRERGVTNVLGVSVWAENDEHAVKIANEFRGQMIAKDQWLP